MPGARVRWGIGDAIAAFAVGLVVSLVAAAFVVDPDHPNDPTTLAVLICSQNFAIIGWLALVARRKGTGSLRSDFGLTLRRPPAAWLADVPYFFLGIGLQLVALLPIGLLNELYGHTAKQDVVNTADKASGWQIPVLALAIVLLAPLTEELLFRGDAPALPAAQDDPGERGPDDRGRVRPGPRAGRSRRWARSSPCPRSSCWASCSGYQAVRTGNLSRSILLHMGFNALSVVFLFL